MPICGCHNGPGALWLVLAIAGVGSFLPAHGGSQGAPRPDTVKAVIETYATIVHASYEDAYTEARALQAAVHALVAQPSPAALEAAKTAWKQARLPYGQTEVYRFYAGPIDADGVCSGYV